MHLNIEAMKPQRVRPAALDVLSRLKMYYFDECRFCHEEKLQNGDFFPLTNLVCLMTAPFKGQNLDSEMINVQNCRVHSFSS